MSRVIQFIIVSAIYSYVYLTNFTKESKNSETVLRQIRKTTKKPLFRWHQKYVETDSSSNAAARGPEERAFDN